MSTDVVNLEAEEQKELGNEYFRNGDFEKAAEFFTKAIEIDNKNFKYLTNRSLCFASLNQWGKSCHDAKTAVSISPNYEKAHFRLVKALIEIERFKEARICLLLALKECGETKDLKSLENLIFVRTHIALRPKSTDFEIIDELGDGNFSKVYKACHKVTKKHYAIKAIERATVDRMKRRHGNINNEILMEKRALHKLEHDGVVMLYCTFQDYGTLYYQMEYVAGRDLWSLMQENLDSTQAQVGCHWTQARFFLAEAIDAVEHMHRNGIVHRDIKPENMMITADGHLKFVDFGTAKDLFQPDLNGPDFVGTAEYMAPSTVNNKAGGVEVDLWALGAVLCQMILGYTPFGSASPYLVFLRIKRAHLRIPDWVPEQIASLMRLLLTKDGQDRLSCATGSTVDFNSNHSELKNISYDTLRAQPFFSDWVSTSTVQDRRALEFAGAQLPDHLHSSYLPVCVPEAPVVEDLSTDDQTAIAALIPKYFQLDEPDALSTVEGVRSAYRRPAVQTAPQHELFIRSLGRACLTLAEATADNGGVRPDVSWMQAFDLTKLSPPDQRRIAHYLSRRGRLHGPGVFRLFCATAVDARSLRADASTRDYVGFTRQIQGHWNKDFVFAHVSNPGAPMGVLETGGGDETRLRATIATINKLRPKFVVVNGDLTSSYPSDAIHGVQCEAFRKIMARLSDTIPALYVPGARDVGETPTMESLCQYRAQFGADYYGAWFGGVRCLILNSPLMCNPVNASEEAQLQDLWLTEEIEQAKLCATSIVVFTYHPWFHAQVDEADQYAEVGDKGVKVRSNFPKDLRLKWLQKLRHHKVQFTFSSFFDRPSIIGTDALSTLNSKMLRPFVPIKRPAYVDDEDDEDDQTIVKPIDQRTVDYANSGEPLRPSEIIAQAVATGELIEENTHHVNNEDVVDVTEDVDLCAAASTDSDKEGCTNKEEDGSSKEDFPNEEDDYGGPALLRTPPLSWRESDRKSGGICGGVRFVLVEENNMMNVFCKFSSLPSTNSELLCLFK